MRHSMNKKVDLKDEFAKIDKFEFPTSCQEPLISDNKKDALYIVDKTLYIETKRILQEPNISLNGKIFYLDSKEYVIDNSFMNFYTNNTEPSCLKIYEFHEKTFSGKNKLFRCIIPHFYYKNVSFDNSFSTDLLCDVSDSTNQQTNNGISANINEIPCFIYFIENKLVIESHLVQNYMDFINMCIALTSMLGFFTGYCQKDKAYIFEYDNFSQPSKGFAYNSSFSDTYNTQHCLISTNRYKYKKKNHTLGYQLHGSNIDGLGVATKKVFEHMYKIIQTNDEFNLAFYSLENIINGHSISSLNNALFCVTLETLTELICKENEESMTWHKDKQIRKKHRNELLKVSKMFFHDNNIADWDKSYVKSRLENIDAPTNSDKLTKPFNILGIELTDEERVVIDNRNKFLHGRHDYKINDSDKLLSDFYRLNYLVHALILKYIGFSGKIINKNKDLGDSEVYKQL